MHTTGLCRIPSWPRGWTCGSVGGQLQGQGSLSSLGQHLQSNGCPCPSPDPVQSSLQHLSLHLSELIKRFQAKQTHQNGFLHGVFRNNERAHGRHIHLSPERAPFISRSLRLVQQLVGCDSRWSPVFQRDTQTLQPLKGSGPRDRSVVLASAGVRRGRRRVLQALLCSPSPPVCREETKGWNSPLPSARSSSLAPLWYVTLLLQSC